MDAALKKGVLLLVVVFVGFYLVKDPAGMANFTKAAGGAIWGALTGLFDTVIKFIDALAG